MPGRRLLVATLAAAALAAGLAGPAAAQDSAYTLPVEISGTPAIAATLTAQAPPGVPETGRTWQWSRCRDGSCTPIPDATASAYVVSRADEGHALQVALVVDVGGVTFAGTSAPTAVVTSPPVADVLPGWTGTAREGEQLTGTAGLWWGTEPIGLAAAWMRCDAGGGSCEPISGATALSYTLTEADVGHSVRLRVTATGPAGATPALSPATPEVVAAQRSAPSGGSFSTTGTAPSPATPGEDPAVAPAEPSLRFIRPFPVVRVAGRFTRRSTRITVVQVRAPRGVRLEIRCRSRRRGCPYSRKAFMSRTVRVRRMQRTYRPGAVLEFRISKAGRIGKYTRLRIRASRPPARVDRCLMPGSRRPRACPAM